MKNKELISTATEHQEVATQFIKELRQAERFYPNWPIDVIHRQAILAEEVGELTRTCLDFEGYQGDLEDVRKEVIQVGAMAFRFLISLSREG